MLNDVDIEDVDDVSDLTMPGALWRNTHIATVVGILGDQAPPVFSYGKSFYNEDRWVTIFFTKAMCDWAKANPKTQPSKEDVTAWVDHANNYDFNPVNRRIVVAETPNRLSRFVSDALTGGLVHESFHTKYTRRKNLVASEVVPEVLKRWTQLPDWSEFESMIHRWSNLFEDIRIETLGQRDFPNVLGALVCVNEFVIDMEIESAEKFKEEVKKASEGLDEDKRRANDLLVQEEGKMGALLMSIRDIGKGYASLSSKIESTLNHRRSTYPDVFDMIENSGIMPIIRRSQRLTRKDDVACVWLAMDFCVILSQILNPSELQKAQERAKSALAQSGKTVCPSCGAGAKHLTARSISNGKGGVVKGKVRITCSKCGHSFDVDVLSGGGKGSGAGGGTGLNAKSKKKGGSGSGPAPKETIDFDGDDFDDLIDDVEEDESKDGESKDGESKDGAVEPNENWGEMAKSLLNDKGRILTEETALEQHFKDAHKVEDAKKDHLQRGNPGKKGRSSDLKVWRPFSTSMDTIAMVKPNQSQAAEAQRILVEVRATTHALTAKLRRILSTSEAIDTFHGTPRGIGLSGRTLVDTVATLRSGKVPARAFYTRSEKRDTKAAVALVIDESGSMGCQLEGVTACMITLSSSLDALGCPTFIAGFQNGDRRLQMPENMSHEDLKSYHRTSTIHHRIYKKFGENFHRALPRMGAASANGGTPMSDGIQLGMEALSTRREPQKICFVLTDGEPDYDHAAVVNWQCAIARQYGILLFGLGIGHHARGVKETFQESIWVEDIKDLPNQLIIEMTKKLDRRHQ